MSDRNQTLHTQQTLQLTFEGVLEESLGWHNENEHDDKCDVYVWLCFRNELGNCFSWKHKEHVGAQ